MKVFENRVLRKIFRPKSDEVTGEWRRPHYDELHDLYSTRYYMSDKIRDETGEDM
jgi:hypothetical protein